MPLRCRGMRWAWSRACLRPHAGATHATWRSLPSLRPPTQITNDSPEIQGHGSLASDGSLLLRMQARPGGAGHGDSRPLAASQAHAWPLCCGLPQPAAEPPIGCNHSPFYPDFLAQNLLEPGKAVDVTYLVQASYTKSDKTADEARAALRADALPTLLLPLHRRRHMQPSCPAGLGHPLALLPAGAGLHV